MPVCRTAFAVSLLMCLPVVLQVLTVAIFDKKGFQMIDTVHSEVVLESKERKVIIEASSIV